MEDADVGFLPVGENDKLVGMITDRDLALRAVARGKDPKKTKVRDVMTEKVPSIGSEDDDIADAAENMAELRVAAPTDCGRSQEIGGRSVHR